MNSEPASALQNIARCILTSASLALACSAAQASDPLAGQLIHAFNRADLGTDPSGGVLRDSDGAYYGVTELGGSSNPLFAGTGTAYRISAAGAFSLLHVFAPGAGGIFPSSSLIRGPDGAFYGVTSGSNRDDDRGTVYRITVSGQTSVLQQFSGSGTDGRFPSEALVLGSDGNFYGTTRFGGADDAGTVFRLTPAGGFTVLHAFAAGSGIPTSALVQGPNGSYYGTTLLFGGQAGGSVFRITPGGSLSTVHAFDLLTGISPESGLTLGRDGHFYGTTSSGGPRGGGVVYQLSTAGGFQMLHAFIDDNLPNVQDPNGTAPRARLLEGADNALYGTTVIGGRNQRGVVYKVTRSGEFTVLHHFDSPIGANASTELTAAPDGTYYGTTLRGGMWNRGSVYRLLTKYGFDLDSTAPPAPAPSPGVPTIGAFVDVEVTLTEPSSAIVSVPYTATTSRRSLIPQFSTTPLDRVVFQSGQTHQTIRVQTRLPANVPQCDRDVVLTLGTAANAAPGDVITRTVALRSERPLPPNLCALL
ncbi:choice-of-anchor tandem repeat GloVer-containing protein [Nevskia sp.]|uniref:choice-of-anchor tandem repeat GloVer-containing protein n=1 Tax=Nevskia sp. TaxID=1929292 RepID=UPI0025DC0BBB|nr:choice-of-anchor tandem repeat GloVer-containing protein [Nevskia sp.]